MTTTASTEVEWATIALGKVVVATEERVWLDSPLDDQEHFAKLITGTGNTAITRNLLDGAMAAAKVAISSDNKPPALTPNRLVWQLAGAYQIAHATPTLMREAGERFASAGRYDLSDWAYEKAKEETGHAQLVLLDIESLGYRAEDLVQAIIPPAATISLEYFQRSVRDEDPIDCVGHCYASERLSLGVKKEHFQKIESILPKNVKATRWLKIHSSLGADAKHVEENVEIIAKLSSTECNRVIRACYESSLLFFSPPQEGYLEEAELENMLKPFKSEA